MNICALIPAYNESSHIVDVVERTKKFVDCVVVYDDGSSDDTVLNAKNAGATVVVHEVNQGKGATLSDGINWAVENGYEFVITLDADGQHLPEEIHRFTDAAENFDLIVGSRMSECENMPFVRKCTNVFMSWVVSRLARTKIPDSQSGFRLVRCESWKKLEILSRNFDFESEMLVEAGRKGLRVGDVPISTVYGDEVSKINPVADTIRFIKMCYRLL